MRKESGEENTLEGREELKTTLRRQEMENKKEEKNRKGES